MDKAVESSDEKHCSDMVSGMVDEPWIELRTRKIVEEIWKGEEDYICREVEKILYERRGEESMIMMLRHEVDPQGRKHLHQLWWTESKPSRGFLLLLPTKPEKSNS